VEVTITERKSINFPFLNFLKRLILILSFIFCLVTQDSAYDGTNCHGIAGLDCWIAQSNLVDWIVIDNPKSKLDFGFGLSIQFWNFNPNPKYHNYFIKKLKFHSASGKQWSQATFLSKFSNNLFICKVVSW